MLEVMRCRGGWPNIWRHYRQHDNRQQQKPRRNLAEPSHCRYICAPHYLLTPSSWTIKPHRVILWNARFGQGISSDAEPSFGCSPTVMGDAGANAVADNAADDETQCLIEHSFAPHGSFACLRCTVEYRPKTTITVRTSIIIWLIASPFHFEPLPAADAHTE